MDDTGDSTMGDPSDFTPKSEYGDFEISSESLELFFKTEIEFQG